VLTGAPRSGARPRTMSTDRVACRAWFLGFCLPCLPGRGGLHHDGSLRPCAAVIRALESCLEPLLDIIARRLVALDDLDVAVGVHVEVREDRRSDVELSRMICPRVQGAEGHECSVEVTSPRRIDLRSGVDRTCAALVSMRWVADSERAPRREPSSSGQVVRNRSWPHESDARAVRRGQEPYPGPVGGDV